MIAATCSGVASAPRPSGACDSLHLKTIRAVARREEVVGQRRVRGGAGNARTPATLQSIAVLPSAQMTASSGRSSEPRDDVPQWSRTTGGGLA
jgi:hypothetical protein